MFFKEFFKELRDSLNDPFDAFPAEFTSTIIATKNTLNTKGETLQLAAKVASWEASDDEEIPDVAWKVDDSSVASIDQDSGLLTAISNGTVTITADLEDDYHTSGSLTITVSNQGLFKVDILGATAINIKKGALELTPQITEDDQVRSLDDFEIDWTIITGTDLVKDKILDNKNIQITAVKDGDIKVKAECILLQSSKLHTIKISNQSITATQIEIENTGNPTQLIVGESYTAKVTLDEAWTDEVLPVITNLKATGNKLSKPKLDDTNTILKQNFMVLNGGLNINLDCLGQSLNIKSLAGTKRVYKKKALNQSEASELLAFSKLTAHTFYFDNGVISNTTNDLINLNVIAPDEVLTFTSLEWKSDKPNACSLVKIDGKVATFKILAPDESIIITASLKYLGESFDITTTFDIDKKTAEENTEYVISTLLSPPPVVSVESLTKPILLNIMLTPSVVGNARMLTYPIFSNTKGLTLKETIVNALDLQDIDNISNLEACLTENGNYTNVNNNQRIGSCIGHNNEKQCFAKATINNSYLYTQADDSAYHENNIPKYDYFNGELLIIAVLDNKLGSWNSLLNDQLELVKALGKGNSNLFKLHNIPAPTAYGKYSYQFLKDEKEFILNVEIKKPSNIIGLNPILKIEQELIELIQTKSNDGNNISTRGISRTAAMATSGNIKSGPVGAYHCSSWFKANSTGCTLFFDRLPATKDSLIAIGHHNAVDANKGKMNVYDIHWAKGSSNIQKGSKKVTL